MLDLENSGMRSVWWLGCYLLWLQPGRQVTARRAKQEGKREVRAGWADHDPERVRVDGAEKGRLGQVDSQLVIR